MISCRDRLIHRPLIPASTSDRFLECDVTRRIYNTSICSASGGVAIENEAFPWQGEPSTSS